MSTSPLSHKNLAVLVAALALAGCNGGSSTTSVITPSTGITLSGNAVTSGTPSAPASIASAGRVSAAATVRPAGVALADGTVELYKIFPDGVETKVDIGTVTTDSSGNYTIPDVPVAETGSGAGTDFYYEVRISDGTGTDMRAPVAPGVDTVVGVSPATNLAAHILTDVAKVPGSADLPTPSAELIESMRKLTSEDADKLDTDGSATIPEATTAGAAVVVASANGLASAGGDAEKLYKAVQFESELLAVTTGGTATSADAGAYIKRVTREGDDQISTGNALPAIAADAMGQAMIDNTTFTPREIITAYNANNGNAPDADETAKVEQFVKMLSGVQDKFDDSFDTSSNAPTDMDKDSQLALYTKRDLSSTTFSATTTLDPDQAVAFLQSLPKDSTDHNSKVGGFNQNVDITAIVKDLTHDVTLATPKIADAQIYHNSGFGCNQNAGFGHFMADVDVYTANPAVTVTGVTITSSDATALGGDGTEALTLMGNRWTSNANGVCVTLGASVTYTVTAALSNSTTATTTVTRTHPLIPEATTTVGGVAASGDSLHPNILTDARPVYSWSTVGLVGAPAGSEVKYTYEFAHIAITGAKAGGPLNTQTYPACTSVSSGRMYSVANFMPTEDCDVTACAAATGELESNIACRINIQTYLVDEYDRLLGQSAGNFTYFCVDLNADGSCG